MFAAFFVIIAGLLFCIALYEWIAIVFAIGLVFAMELSSIENIADFVSPEKHDAIKKIKDLSAAGVLIAAIVALCVGLTIFTPKIVEFIHVIIL
ncbi:MAG: diacylglycerol kinase family protein [Lachnospirales bacterium]